MTSTRPFVAARKNFGELMAEFFLHVATGNDCPFQRVFGGARRRDERGTCGRQDDGDCRQSNTNFHNVLPKDSGCYLFSGCRTIC